MVGRTVMQYEFLEKLGEGGMGQIYKARDTRLNRFVAVKVLPAGKSRDPDRRRRFRQEAQAASALNHPNIITIHDVISDSGTDYMVLEHVSGQTLTDLIPPGGLRIPLVVKYAVQMAAALETAHAAGIIHRDLKPGNVMVTTSGLIKLLDFGLAKLTDPSPLSSGDNDETVVMRPQLTMEGVILGTVSYMSPEQGEGKRVDARSDIFSFGAVLYEMVTGRRAFEGDSDLSTLSAILRDEPRPVNEAVPAVPAALDELLQRCLRKKPADRYQSMNEVHAQLAALQRDAGTGVLLRPSVVAPQARPSKARPLIAAAVLLVALAGAGASWWFRDR